MNDELKEDILKEVFSWAKTIALALALALFINNFIIINAVVKSGSMETTIMTHDRLFGNRLSYTFSEPKRADIMVFIPPHDRDVLYVKRVIGLPGETVDILEGDVYIDGIKLDEPYISSNDYKDFGPYNIPQGNYLMLGDNRAHSEDSRYWGYLSEEDIVGKAIFRYWPMPKIIK